MCGKRSLKATALSESDDGDTVKQSPSKQAKTAGKNVLVNGTSENPSPVKKLKDDETPEEKKLRRKQEKINRKLHSRLKRGILPPGPGCSKKVLAKFNTVWDREGAFVTQVMQCLPEVRQPGYLLEEEEKEEEYLKMDDATQDEAKEKTKAQKFHDKVRRNLKQQGFETTTQRAKSYQELQERLRLKLAEKAQTPNEKKREKKLKKKLKRAQEKEKSNKGKKLISQSAKSAGASTEESTSTVTSQPEQPEKKTPLKKPVVKSNGQIVYSKFDFISKHKGDHLQSTFGNSSFNGNVKGSVKPKAEELLKKVEKQEKKISMLAKHGKQDEAVSLVESQKWDTALKRADGDKVRDDAYLLKKTVKKQEKMKQLTKKKWKERVERVEKQKEMRQQKRQANIQERKDDKKKRTKKLMRKKGRIA